MLASFATSHASTLQKGKASKEGCRSLLHHCSPKCICAARCCCGAASVSSLSNLRQAHFTGTIQLLCKQGPVGALNHCCIQNSTSVAVLAGTCQEAISIRLAVGLCGHLAGFHSGSSGSILEFEGIESRSAEGIGGVSDPSTPAHTSCLCVVRISVTDGGVPALQPVLPPYNEQPKPPSHADGVWQHRRFQLLTMVEYICAPTWQPVVSPTQTPSE
jgi:hypothetical protein